MSCSAAVTTVDSTSVFAFVDSDLLKADGLQTANLLTLLKENNDFERNMTGQQEKSEIIVYL